MTIKELFEKYQLTNLDCWELIRNKKKIWIITHDACEKIASSKATRPRMATIITDRYGRFFFALLSLLSPHATLRSPRGTITTTITVG